MKNSLLTLSLLLSIVFATAQTKTDTMTNEKVIKLSKLGLQSTVLINKIQTSFTLFDISTDGLIALSENGVPSDVINVMMNIQTEAQTALANQRDLNDPLTPRATGIYYYNPGNTANPIRRIDPTVANSLKSGGFGSALMSAYTYGVSSTQTKSSLAGADSRLQIEETNPTFYFYFDNSTVENSDNWFFATASTPNEFLLLKLTTKSSSREIILGSENSYGGSSGISSKAAQAFTYENEAPGIYKLTLKTPLKPGEYCFMYGSATPSRFDNNKVFDFGIAGKE